LKKVLITGALGQDGRILSKIYIKKKFKVYGIVKKKKFPLIKKVKYFQNNLKIKNKLTTIIEEVKPEIIIHLASYNESYSKRKKDTYKKNYKTNILISKNLIDVLINSGIKFKFIFAGSSLMFDKSKRIVTEKSKFNSNEYYGKYKIYIHKYLEKLQKKRRLNSCTAILFNHDSIHRDKKFLIPRIISAFKSNNKKFIQKIYSLNISGDFSSAKEICLGIYKLSIYKKKISKIILSSGKRFYINEFINDINTGYNFKLIRNKKLNKKNKNILGSNKLAKKIINFKVNDNYLKSLKKMFNI
tara:strand:+ start:21323 stop:22222 length:900 start_codon:yes stop_codon:yes gene_type:complete